MRRALVVLCAFVLVLGTMIPAASAATASQLPNYEPVDIGSKFYAEPATPGMIETLPGDEATGTATAAAAGTMAVGEQKRFLVLNDLTGGYSYAYFTLRAVGVHGEIWVQNNLDFPAGDRRNPVIVTDAQLNYLMGEFDNNIYPKEAAFFGLPGTHTGANAALGTPGYYQSADGTDRTIILIENVRDQSYFDSTYPNYIAGFFSSAFKRYFDRNIITIDPLDWANRVGPNTAPWRGPDPARWRPNMYEGTFAHEYQHLLHNEIDSDEETWINEGMSDYATLLTGYTDLNTDGHINARLEHPYNSLTAWQDQGGVEILSDYGGAYLFQLYLSQLFGSDFTNALVHNTDNGIASVNSTLRQMGIPRTYADVYRDWTTAMLVNSKTAPAKYSITGLNKAINLDGRGDAGAQVLPWGPAYYQIKANPKINNLMIDGISFLPTPWTAVTDPLNAGNKALFGGAANLADNQLVLPLDLTGQTAPTLTFKSLYDIEEGWDFGMVQVSTDNGQTWTSLANANTVSSYDPSAHPNIIANLPGLTGYSGGWVDESYDLSAYAGQKVLVAFRYMTDWGSLGNGFLANPGWYIDDVRVAGFTSDGSSLQGFQGIDQILNRFVDYLITFAGHKQGGTNEWQVLQLDMQSFNEGTQIELQKFLRDSALSEVVVIVSYAAPQGTTSAVPFTYTVERKSEAPNHKK